ncbi:hypothetical protein OPKNFCMD_6335 [Methylobacterium crusticola]|uniref:Copper resistance protein CopC n=1 Tax=Methylobacterium crusticola TaxID=1697972 RepID=A0ABQ4R768_9HYPH|nr:hypothetical protein [Methylobacterium crusticola]GJD53558.1 hypothetical protein OPKNFCMD_6335 [Methylobacterium crusticola]
MSHGACSSGQTVGWTTKSKLVSTALAALVLVGTAVTPAAAGHFLAEPPAAAKAVRLSPLHTTMSFRRVSAVGQTKPSGAALDWRAGTTSGLDAQSHRLDQLISTTICSRC